MSNLFVGIDIAKEYATAQGLDGHTKKLFFIRFAMNAMGFSELRNTIMQHTDNVADVTVAMESTGCYHINLFAFLCSEGFRCRITSYNVGYTQLVRYRCHYGKAGSHISCIIKESK